MEKEQSKEEVEAGNAEKTKAEAAEEEVEIITLGEGDDEVNDDEGDDDDDEVKGDEGDGDDDEVKGDEGDGDDDDASTVDAQSAESITGEADTEDEIAVIHINDDEQDDVADDLEMSMVKPGAPVISQMLGTDPDDEVPEKRPIDEADKPRVDISHPLAQDIIINPTKWLIWPAVAVLRWLLRHATKDARRIVYRSEPTLNFPASEIRDIAVDVEGIELILSAPGIAVAGSALPTSDIAKIVHDKRRGGALSDWLDCIGDRFMHALEASQGRNNPSFSLSTGGRIEYIALAANIVGQSAPLAAYSGGQFSTARRSMPEGAVGLAAMYMGAVSASRLEDMFRAVTELPAHVREFTGAELPITWPARLGGRLGRMLGLECTHPDAGIEIIIEGGSEPDAVKWAQHPARRNSLALLASSFLGSSCPSPSIFLLLNADNVPSATLNGNAYLGGLAVLGKPLLPTFIPLV